jgi:hypothetical protein
MRVRDHHRQGDFLEAALIVDVVSEIGDEVGVVLR